MSDELHNTNQECDLAKSQFEAALHLASKEDHAAIAVCALIEAVMWEGENTVDKGHAAIGYLSCIAAVAWQRPPFQKWVEWISQKQWHRLEASFHRCKDEAALRQKSRGTAELPRFLWYTKVKRCSHG